MEEYDFTAEAETLESRELVPANWTPQLPQAMNSGMVQAHTPYVSAMQVMKPRNMDAIEKHILRSAAQVGEKACYGWGAGKGRVEGISIKMAMIMFNSFGNMTVVAEPVQETSDAWIFTHYIVDLETGASAPRQWRESKRSVVDGKMDPDRKDQLRFNRGQSKNIRNVILNRMPQWLINKVMDEAKKGARDRLQKFIDSKGIAVAQKYAVDQLGRHGVTEDQILEKMGKAEIKGLDIEDLVHLAADLNAIDSGEEYASTLFPSKKEAETKIDLKDKLRDKLSASKAAHKPEADVSKLEAMRVALGKEPFSWQVTDAGSTYNVWAEGGGRLCNCPNGGNGSCLHIMAVVRSEG